MQALLLRLSALDADAGNAVRVISFFDALVRNRADAPTLVRAAARLAERPCGLSAPTAGVLLRATPDGTRLDPVAEPPPDAATHPLEGGGQVWVERTADAALALDPILLERFAIAAAVLLGHQKLPAPELGDPALLELVLSQSAGDAERARALHLMGIAPGARVRVLAVAGGGGEGDGADLAVGCRPGHRAVLGDLRALLTVDGGDFDVPVRVPVPVPPPGTRVGIGACVPAAQAWRSWLSARTALRFTGEGVPGGDAATAHLTGAPVVRWDDLGAYALLAEHVPLAALAESPDLGALDRLAAEPSGAAMLHTLHVYCAAESLRRAALDLHLHRSSVADRLARAGATLGFPITTAAGRARLTPALVLRRLRDNSPAEVATSDR